MWPNTRLCKLRLNWAGPGLPGELSGSGYWVSFRDSLERRKMHCSQSTSAPMLLKNSGCMRTYIRWLEPGGDHTNCLTVCHWRLTLHVWTFVCDCRLAHCRRCLKKLVLHVGRSKTIVYNVDRKAFCKHPISINSFMRTYIDVENTYLIILSNLYM